MSKIDVEKYGPTEDPVTWPLASNCTACECLEPSELYRKFERGYKIAIGVMLALLGAFNAWLIWLIWF